MESKSRQDKINPEEMDRAAEQQSQLGHTFGNITVHGTAHLGDIVNHEQQKDNRDKLLRSLDHAELHTRKHTIGEPHSQTFQWILDDQPVHLPYGLVQSWASFPKWLRTGGTVYLIEGKPGSGKSTLMRSIMESKRRLAGVLGGSSLSPVVAAHFIWLAGTKMQRSYFGLLASLSHQLCRQTDSATVDRILYDLGMSTLDLHTVLEWSEHQLKRLLLTLLAHVTCVCAILVDALDEFDPEDRPARLMGLLSEIQHSSPYVRLCVSSRPTHWLQEQFSTAKRLRLQDLTKEDIRIYARAVLDEEFDFSASDLATEHDYLVETILTKADGVFLWVKYAVHAISKGICAMDDAATLRSRIDGLPAGMEEVFQHMWQRYENSNAPHREEAAKVLYCSRFLPELSLFEFAVISDPQLQAHYSNTFDPEPLSTVVLNSKVALAQKRLHVRSAGLLVPSYVSRRGEVVFSANITYLHRSAHDFLWSTEFGRAIVQLGPLQKHDILRRRWVSILTRHIHSPRDLDVRGLHEICGEIAQHALLLPLNESDICNKWAETVLLVRNVLESVLVKRSMNTSYLTMNAMIVNAQTFPADFIGLLAHFGAFDTVKHVLMSRCHTPSYLGYLFVIAASILQQTVRVEGLLEFIRWTIDQGADLQSPLKLPVDIQTWTGLAKQVIVLSPLDVFFNLWLRHARLQMLLQQSQAADLSRVEEQFQSIDDIMSLCIQKLSVNATAWCVVGLTTGDCLPIISEHRLHLAASGHLVEVCFDVAKVHQLVHRGDTKSAELWEDWDFFYTGFLGEATTSSDDVCTYMRPAVARSRVTEDDLVKLLLRLSETDGSPVRMVSDLRREFDVLREWTRRGILFPAEHSRFTPPV